MKRDFAKEKYFSQVESGVCAVKPELKGKFNFGALTLWDDIYYLYITKVPVQTAIQKILSVLDK